MTSFKLGLCGGRHDLPVTDFVFNDGDITFPINPKVLASIADANIKGLGVDFGDHLDVYVTGLTAATTAVISVAIKNNYSLTLHHYDAGSGTYIADVILDGSMDNHDSDFPSIICAAPNGKIF